MDNFNQTPEVSNAETFEFTGNGWEYFKIWIVNLLLTIITFGIYGAWAKVRTNRYFYGNTKLNSKSFDYLATPIMILKGRIIAVGVLILVSVLNQFYPIAGIGLMLLLACAFPWVLWRSIKFNLRMTSYRNVRFAFKGELGRMYWIMFINFLFPIVIAGLVGGVLYFLNGFDTDEMLAKNSSIMLMAFIITAYILFPFIQKLFSEYYLSHAAFGQGQFNTHLSTWHFYKPYLIVVISSILIMSAFALVTVLVKDNSAIKALMMSFEPQHGAPPDVGKILPFILGIYAFMILLFIWLNAFIRVKIRDHIMPNTHLDNSLSFLSKMTVGSLTLLNITNLLILVFTLGLGMAWVAVRSARYEINHTSVYSHGDLSEYVNEQLEHQNSLGDELGEAFDIDMDLAV